MREFDRKIVNKRLQIEGKIQGYCPMQGYGTVSSFPFYFRARHEEWSFAISENPQIDPVDIEFPETGKQYGFFKAEKYEKEGDNSAGWMELGEAERIITECCEEYIKSKNIG